MDDDAGAVYRERGLGGAQAPGNRPCLLIVDLTNGFTDPGSDLACDAEDALANVGALLDEARSHGVPRVYTTVEYDEEGFREAAAFLEKVPALAALESGTHWCRVDDRIAPGPGERVLSKRFASAFWGTELGTLLEEWGCDSVILTGASTSGCVRASAVDALQHGYRVVVPRDAVADRARAPHEATLFDIQAKYGEVVDTPAAIEMIRAARVGSGQAP